MHDLHILSVIERVLCNALKKSEVKTNILEMSMLESRNGDKKEMLNSRPIN